MFILFLIEQCKQVFVHLSDGKIFCYNGEFFKLKSFVEAKTGIPQAFQQLFYQNKLIRSGSDFPCDANIQLKLQVMGGQNNCELCFGNVSVFCTDCEQHFCNECSTRFHRHPKRSNHNIKLNEEIPCCSENELSQNSNNDDFGADISMQDAMLVSTLAERFGLTSFKCFQRTVIDAVLEGRDTLVVHPTGSGKSLCFQFPPVFQNKKSIVVTPTISLMQDQSFGLQQKAIGSIFLGSAQMDREAEYKALDPHSDIRVIYVTPEWITKPDKLSKVQKLAHDGALTLIAIDEAHLASDWSDFRKAYLHLENLRLSFPKTPIMALTATATPEVEKDIKKLLRDPLVTRASVNRPNILLSAKEVNVAPGSTYHSTFADHVAEISRSEPTIIYTDFIADIGPIVSALSDLGIDAVGYYGEMDPRERKQSYLKWKTGEVTIMVATKAFGMGIDKNNIRHVIRNGVPESIVSWAQEFGRAGRDGCPSTATILYQNANVNHANAWIKNNIMDRDRCNRILSDFSNSWRFVEAHLAGCCRRKLLLDLFGENNELEADSACCDVCSSGDKSTPRPLASFNEELKILEDAMKQVGIKGAVKIAEWVRGSSASWTSKYDKTSFSYGNSKGHTLEQWRLFLRQCHVLGIVKYDLRSMIKGSGHYSVMGIYYPLDDCKPYINNEKSLMLPVLEQSIESRPCRNRPSTSASECSLKKKRLGKGCNILPIVRKLLVDKENWKTIADKSDYQFPGTFKTPTEQHLYYIPDWKSLKQASETNHHFLWNDIQMSKGVLNKDRLIEVEIGDEKEKVYYRSAPCLGVKTCPEFGCDYVAPIREKRNCKNHPQHKLQRCNTDCPVEFVYIYPTECEGDHRRWIGGIVRNQRKHSSNLHSHPLHGGFKICSLVQEKVRNAIQSNPSLTPTDISLGTGIGFIPSAIDSASSHHGRMAREVAKKKIVMGLKDKNWSPCNLEDAVGTLDDDDNQISHNIDQDMKYQGYGRPYLISAGVENGIKYSFAMSPLMAKVLSEAQFLQTDITYNENTQYPYLFNAVAFNDVTMDWMVVSRVWLDTQNHLGYKLAFQKMFDTCKERFPNFDAGETLKAIILDWSDAQVNGLKEAIGETKATALIKGCKVHWLRSCQRVADKITSNKSTERELLLKIARKIQSLSSAVDIVACFETLCDTRSLEQLLDKIPGLYTKSEAQLADSQKNWSSAKCWAQWWTRSAHLKMLSRVFTEMDSNIWSESPTTTNAVERKNRDCKCDGVSLKQAMLKVYKVDKLHCLRHITAENGSSISYRSRSTEARTAEAKKRQKQRYSNIPADKALEFGPPDKVTNFNKSGSESRKRPSSNEDSQAVKKVAIEVNDGIVQYIPDSHPEVMGKKVRMKFEITDSGDSEWYEGIISTYNGINQKYGVYFPCDQETVFVNLDDSDLEIMD